ncbi:MAG: SDR family NAD(P)-dependent oxidoreductase [Hyphomicrobiaceae bacterium]
MDLQDQIVIVTGGGQGIGRACALAMAKAGANVAVVDINGEKAKLVAAEVTKLGRRALAITADLGSVPDIDRMVTETVKMFGHVDALVNNAGVTRRADIMDLTEEDWDRIHRVNAKGVFFCLQRVAKEMIPRRSGRIINIASVAGKGFRGTSNAVYAASKGAVISLTKTAAQQLGGYNINVNAVCPGVVLTDMVAALIKTDADRLGISLQEAEKRFVADIPLKRANQPEDIADMCVFLASPGARNVSGQSINVDGALVPH